jgi:hypothetical protein
MTNLPVNDPRNREGYNLYPDYDTFPYQCIDFLINNNEMIWKLLKYNTPDAWKKSNLSSSEKRDLIYNAQEDSSLYRVFMDTGQSDVVTGEQSILRISNYAIYPENRTVSTMSMMFEIYSHYKINHLNNYKVRVDVIIGELLKTFNGVDVGAGIGRLNFDRLGNINDRMINGSQIPFKGKWIIMGNKLA